MALTDAQRLAVAAEFMRELSARRENIPALTKAQVRAVAAGIDAKIDAAMPNLIAGSGLSQAQIETITLLILMKRRGL